jgi:hypothetical protein
MRNIKFFVVLSLTLLSIWSCEKDNRSSQSKQAAQFSNQFSIVGKWAIKTISSESTSDDKSPTFKSSYSGKSGDYYDFKDDGKVEVYQNGVTYRSIYQVTGNQISFILGNGLTITMEITRLTDEDLQLTRQIKKDKLRIDERRVFEKFN